MIYLIKNNNDLQSPLSKLQNLQKRLQVGLVGLCLDNLGLQLRPLLIVKVLLLDQSKDKNDQIAPQNPMRVFLQFFEIRVHLEQIEHPFWTVSNLDCKIGLCSELLVFSLKSLNYRALPRALVPNKKNIKLSHYK